MITHIRIQNYRSFVDAEVDLRPFSLVIGANGAGKTNFLRAIELLSTGAAGNVVWEEKKWIQMAGSWTSHTSVATKNGGLSVVFRDGGTITSGGTPEGRLLLSKLPPWAAKTPIFNPNPDKISGIEVITQNPIVEPDGSGTANVLDSLKNGDREDLFEQIAKSFRLYIPEVEKLSLRTTEKGKKQIQVREKGLKEPLAASELSEGTRLILCILTIVHQENPPPVVLLEDIDRGMHPRIFESVVPLMRDIAERHQINIIATTHNPYLVDCFQDDKEAVIIVEKKDGASTLSTLASKLEGLDYDSVDLDDMPLGNLWYSGMVGGVPLSKAKRVASKA